ncbi:MAG: hypothetical protein JXB88_04960 [Spirochaetales bacterium]|nr:hypothetical protein [Spirochaetales bacterium]
MQITHKLPEIHFSPVMLFIHGFCILPAFIFQKVLLFRVFQTILFIFLSLFHASSSVDKRKQLVFSFFSFLFILVFNMLTPHGEVLFTLFNFPVTLGAINTGIFKATVFTGLLALSKITIAKNLSLPGPAGKMVSKVFYYFGELKEVQGKYKTKDIIKRIDLILLSITPPPDTGDSVPIEQKLKTSRAGILLICISLFFHWGIFILSLYIAK